nr:PREDICTED: uncharacterized protein LOC109031581 [Bemisia tabaci]XP_018898728.1 PREDICTED: uncharacterized protein LOC109031581 [Bemisia tabaci]XP_018898732.1 PREDICTED: uncharacterized protein LOC109031581 [Bemisia tabaci]
MNLLNRGGTDKFQPLLSQFFPAPNSMANKEVNDTCGSSNCSLVTAAALTGTTVSNLLVKNKSLASYSHGALGIEKVLKVLKEAGFTNARLVFEGETKSLNIFLYFNFPRGATQEFALAYTFSGTTSGHVVHAKISKTNDGEVHVFVTDFQQPLHSAERNKREIPRDAFLTYLIAPGRVFTLFYMDLMVLLIAILVLVAIIYLLLAPAMSILIRMFERLKI